MTVKLLNKDHLEFLSLKEGARAFAAHIHKVFTEIQDLSQECVSEKQIFLFFNQSICCGYSKEPSQ